MMEVFVRELSKSIWKELGEEAAKKAIGAFIGEGIKAAFDVWKARQIKELDVEFKERQKKADAAENAAKESDSSGPTENSPKNLSVLA